MPTFPFRKGSMVSEVSLVNMAPVLMESKTLLVTVLDLAPKSIDVYNASTANSSLTNQRRRIQ